MNRELSHDDAFAVLDAAALDVLDASERDAVLAHAERCVICRRELSSLRDAASLIAFAAPPETYTVTADTRRRIRSRLMARATSDRDDPELLSLESRAAERKISALAWRRAEWLAAAASILLVVSAAVLASILRDRDTVRDALKAEVARGQTMRTSSDSLRTALMSRDSLIAGLSGRDVAMMTLSANGDTAAVAHMFWDKAHNIWTLVAHDMPELRPGRTYQLWLMTPTRKISAGTFEPRGGDVMMRAVYPLPENQLRMLAVTEEPAGGMPQPTGPVVMQTREQAELQRH
jgi:hypothetical protein